jgi:hypothetical protein
MWQPAVAECQAAENVQSFLLYCDCVEIGLLAVAAVTAGEGSRGDAEPGEWRSVTRTTLSFTTWPRSMPST